MGKFYIGCHKCGNKNVDIMSVRKNRVKYKDRFIPTAVITYICRDCGWSEDDEHYLYGED